MTERCQHPLAQHGTVSSKGGDVNFDNDLRDIIEGWFASEGIRYNGSDDLSRLVVRYLEMRIRRIPSVPRKVHFSNEIHDSLGKLAREMDPARRDRALEAWGTTFYLWHLFVEGEPVIPFLSERVQDARTRDPLLWDWGIHHLHLRRELGNSGFVKRSDYLLFAVVTDAEAFFVDVRPHTDPEGLLWFRQDLVSIVHSNWPELIDLNVLHGVTGDNLADDQIKMLRHKNTNFAMELGGKAIAPLGGGMTTDGGSLLCRWWADWLLWEIERHRNYFVNDIAAVREALEKKAIDTEGGLNLKLVPVDDLNLPVELARSLQEDDCMSKDLCRMGFVIVEATTLAPLAVEIVSSSP